MVFIATKRNLIIDIEFQNWRQTVKSCGAKWKLQVARHSILELTTNMKAMNTALNSSNLGEDKSQHLSQ